MVYTRFASQLLVTWVVWLGYAFLIDLSIWKKSHLQYFQIFNHKNLGPSSLWRALIDGNTSFAPHHELELLFILGLGHLLSPSGTHLQAVLAPIKWFFPYRRWMSLMLLITWIVTIIIQQFECLGRLSLYLATLPFTSHHACLLLFTFIIDFYLRGSTSILSLSLSMIFIALIRGKTKNLPIWRSQTSFLQHQFFISVILAQPLSLMSWPVNFFSYYFMQLIFPILLVIYFFPLDDLKIYLDILSAHLMDFISNSRSWIMGFDLLSPDKCLIFFALVFHRQLPSYRHFLIVWFIFWPNQAFQPSSPIPRGMYYAKYMGSEVNAKIKCRVKRKNFQSYYSCRLKRLADL